MLFGHLGTVIFQTFKIRIKKPSYWIMVLVPIILMSALLSITWITQNNNSRKINVGIIDNKILSVEMNKNDNLKVINITNNEKEKYLKNKKVEVVIRKDSFKNDFDVLSTHQLSASDKNIIDNELTQYNYKINLINANLSKEQLELISNNKSVNYTTLDKSSESSNQANFAISAVLGIFIFIFLTSYVSMIAQEIANEKSSRIMEILLASTSAKDQYYGKIFGILLLALVQMTIYIVIFFCSFLYFKNHINLQVIDQILSQLNFEILIISIFIVLVSIALYTFLTALIASLINDFNQVQQAIAPITYLAMIGYILAFILPNSTNNIIINILSFIPFFSQTLMPARLSIHSANINQGLLSLGINLITLIILAQVGLKLYSKNVLSYSSDNILKQFLQGLKHINLITKKR
ncbi:ABC transporter permease [Fructobacillus evanidus]|uniref:Permease component NatB (NatB) n=1 Tax=Fructobacillus evanidus TaxID=3064281 RepID=A0ABN9YVB0_9LACO|nr:ABC-type Na+ efflux pump [Fructobacillus sp. LMG 32999]CAK1247471.1 ABC-type Na+ efflux pump [Fructobacillus sp. LMG 32999]CAK1248292.1 ABC-type Na+ efflux pump [Fructobacillus sp. LMG 32999]CAK1248890.1 ABC-type Na+ efflux pump [Fructobacillus sp. LMG 32999]CAK1254069.1 ABC-type Na+ efflux pump [Fructobacillus sp. LMG 32999]